MTAVQHPRTATGSHPFTAAVVARDRDALVDALAPDVVLHSAVAATPFVGREVLADLYASVLESFEELRVTDELAGEDTHALFWQGRIDGRAVAGADLLRLDAEGRVREITVHGRPLPALATFVTAIGARFAGRRRGRLVAVVLRVTARPLPSLLALLDPVARWLMRGRPRVYRARR